MIKATLETGAIYAQQCCPSPFHGYPGALGLEIPKDKAGDMKYINEQIKAKIAAKNGTGRFATWPVKINMLFVEAGAEYAKDWIDGKIKNKNDQAALVKKLNEIAGSPVTATTYAGKDKTGKDVKFDNFYMILSDYIVY